MPNIVQYDATANLEPSDRGTQAAEIAGRRIGLFYHQLASDVKDVGDAVQQHMGVMETSELYKSGSDLQINAIKAYDEASKDPANRSNPHFGDQFMASITPQLEQWQSGAKTDRGKLLAATLGADIRQNIFRHVAAGQAAQDITQYQENKVGFLNNLGAQLQDNPSAQSFENAQALWHQWVQDNTAHISNPEDRERIMREDEESGNAQLTLARYKITANAIVKQVGATGDDSKSPAKIQGEDDIAKKVGFEYLDPTQQAAVSGWIQDATPEGHRQYESTQSFQKQQQVEAVDQALGGITQEIYTSNGAGGVTVNSSPEILDKLNAIQNMPGGFYRNAEIQNLRAALHTATQDRLAGKETVTDHGTFVQLSSEIGSTSNPLTTTEVDKAYAGGKLNDEDYHFLRTSAVDSKQSAPKAVHAFTELNEWLTKIKPLIDKSNPMLGNMDQTGIQNFSYFSWDATQKLKKMIAAGYDPEHALTMMTDPRNPRGLYSFIPKYQVQDGKAGLHSVIQSITTGKPQPIVAPPGGVRQAPPPRGANESTDAYLKRTGG